MFDCANVEMRELLPELAAGTLDSVSRARVEAHVLACAECASELETLRLVRASFAATPAVDTSRIVESLPKPVIGHVRPLMTAPRRVRWTDWRIAAALTMITVGGLSVAVTQRLGNTGPLGRQIDSAITADLDSAIQIANASEPSVTSAVTDSAAKSRSARAPELPPSTRPAKQQLAFGGGTEGELDDASLQALLGALDEIERGPVAPSAEPDRSPVLPVINDGAR